MGGRPLVKKETGDILAGFFLSFFQKYYLETVFLNLLPIML